MTNYNPNTPILSITFVGWGLLFAVASAKADYPTINTSVFNSDVDNFQRPPNCLSIKPLPSRQKTLFLIRVDFIQRTALFRKMLTSRKNRIKPLSVTLDPSDGRASRFTTRLALKRCCGWVLVQILLKNKLISIIWLRFNMQG